MQIRYHKNLNHNYFIIDEQDMMETDYQIHMILDNEIAGLLKCTMHKIDNQIELYYEITSKYSLKQIYEKRKMSYKELKEILQHLGVIFNSMEEYLLDAEHLMMETEFIYMNPKTRELEFCFYPGYSKDINKSFHMVTEYLLDCVDYKDEKAVALAYELYKCTADDNYSIQNLLDDTVFHPDKNDAAVMQIEKDEKDETFENQEKVINSDTSKLKIKDRGSREKVFSMIMKKVFVFINNIFTENSEEEEESLSIEKPLLQVHQEKLETDIQHEYEESQKQVPVMEEYGDTVYFSADSSCGKLIADAGSQYEDFEMLWYPFLIGKLNDAVDGMIQDECISRIHAKIEKREEEYYIIDLNSTNGTYVNGKELCANEPEQIHRGDDIKFGRVLYHFE